MIAMLSGPSTQLLASPASLKNLADAFMLDVCAIGQSDGFPGRSQFFHPPF